MADKPTLGYCIEARQNPANRNEILYVPRLVERAGSTVSLATIVENAIDRGLIAGLKPSAAQGIADALAQQMFKEFSLGHNIQFGSYFYGQLFLDGTVKSAVGPLTSANKLNIRLFKGKDFKLSRDDFTMQLDTNLAAPSITEVIGSDNIAGHLITDENVRIIGSNFGDGKGQSTLTATLLDADGNTVTEDATVASWGPNMVEASFKLPGNAPENAQVTIKLSVTTDDTTLSATKTVTAVSAA